MQNIRTDLAVEAHELSRREAKNATEIDGVISDVRTEDGITVTNIEITNENGSKALGKAIGNYITIESPNLKYSIDIYERVCTLISEEIRTMADIKSDSLTLVVGLGNRDITPDALGTEVVSRLLVTHHIKQNMKDFFDDNISGVCALIPGVLGTTGIETAEYNSSEPVIFFISSASPSEVSGPVAIIVYSSGLISVTSSLNTVTRG